VVLVCVVLAACGGDERMRVSQDQVLRAIEEGTAPAIVDVRTGAEYAKGHVPGAVHVPFYAVGVREAEIGAAKSDPVVVYCAHGPRAGIAKFALWILGYKRVVYLDGHMSAWKKRHLPMNVGRRP
jgi:rhodanese-related sulfurtransferase